MRVGVGGADTLSTAGNPLCPVSPPSTPPTSSLSIGRPLFVFPPDNAGDHASTCEKWKRHFCSVNTLKWQRRQTAGGGQRVGVCEGSRVASHLPGSETGAPGSAAFHQDGPALQTRQPRLCPSRVALSGKVLKVTVHAKFIS